MSKEKRFTLRMDAELFERIKESAEKNRRSIAKEIEYILFQWASLNSEHKSANSQISQDEEK